MTAPVLAAAPSGAAAPAHRLALMVRVALIAGGHAPAGVTPDGRGFADTPNRHPDRPAVLVEWVTEGVHDAAQARAETRAYYQTLRSREYACAFVEDGFGRVFVYVVAPPRRTSAPVPRRTNTCPRCGFAVTDAAWGCFTCGWPDQPPTSNNLDDDEDRS